MLKQFFEKAPELLHFRIRGGNHPLHHWTHGVLTLAVILLLSGYLHRLNHAAQVLHFAKGLFPLLLSLYVYYRLWREQNIILLRYGLQDGKSNLLIFNSLLVIVLSIFPLKYLFNWLADHFYFLLWRMLAGKGFIFSTYYRPEFIPEPTLALLLAFFALGIVAIGLCFFLLYEHSRQSDLHPHLSEEEDLLTAYSATRWLTVVWVAALSALLAFISLATGATPLLFLAGAVYLIVWLSAPFQMKRICRRLQALKEEL